ncbi:MAG: VWA domain-containing protein [Alphaproteobacteria bacterium]|nr:VWA domain-containing protein [Alphaproteobacteria bacterium]
MDGRDLKTVLENVKTPPPGENARKRAVNLALAEFERTQREKEKNFKGSGIASRLTGMTAQKRRDPMKKKYVYGGLATAMVVVLAATVSFQQLLENPKGGFTAELTKVDLSVAGTPADENVSASYRLRMAEADVTRVEEALRTGQSALPTPMPQKEMAANTAGRSATEMPQNFVATAPSVVMDDTVLQPGYQDIGRDQFENFEENPVKVVREEPVSTFSVDVDTASYAFVRRQINNGVLPQKDAVRIEEMINYFDYDYPLPETKEEPFKPTVTVVPSPWAEGRKLVHIGIKGYDIAPDEKPKSNLVFLLDVSGSMNAPDKLPLLKNSFKLLLETLGPDDTVAIVTYAGNAGTVLEPTKASEKAKIMSALENLNAGGATAGAEGIRQAYGLAKSSFDKDAVNRVILATDGDFNVGITNREELKDFVERERMSGIFLSVLGFGQGNLNDHMMQTLAQNGNGVAAYIDTLSEARKVLVEEASSTLFPIAKDVKIQVEFNPATVAEYRLIGYETRALNREDFNNDAVDAGDIGAGHTVTAIYEITPVGGPRTMDETRYAQAEEHKADTDFGDEYGFLKIRYKNPDSDTSKLITTPIPAKEFSPQRNERSATQWRNTTWSTAVAGFGQILKGGKYTGDFSYDDVIELAQSAKGDDPFGYRAEFINLVRLAKSAAAMEKNAP